MQTRLLLTSLMIPFPWQQFLFLAEANYTMSAFVFTVAQLFLICWIKYLLTC